MKNQSIVIDVKNLSKIFAGKVAVFDFSMEAKAGEIIGFLGPNGSGKTTVLRMLCGLLIADKGQGSCLGYNIRTQSDNIRSHVGYMTQHFSLYKYLTILENLKFVARAFNVKNSAQRIDAVVSQLNLGPRLHQLAGNLSGGWKQKIALGAALLRKPKLLLLDEPTAGVDPDARREFWQIIGDIAAENVTVLVSTHYMDEAERCHKIAYLAYGQLVAQGSIEDVIHNSKLNTWRVRGENINQLAKELIKLKGIEQATPFGVHLHVTGKDRKAMLESLHPYLIDMQYHWQGITPTLEDVLINFVADVKEKRFD